MKDAVATMGSLLPEDAGGRDAVHVAVFSAYSTERLRPGEDVGLVNEEGARDLRVSASAEHIGIIDPFIRDRYVGGDERQRFWVYLYPRTITALAHRWNHPAFEHTDSIYAPPSSKLVSEEWLRNFCDTHDCPDYESVLAKAARFIRSGETGSSWNDTEYLHFDGEDTHSEIPPEFWDHVETIIGQKCLSTEKPRYFSCSC